MFGFSSIVMQSSVLFLPWMWKNARGKESRYGIFVLGCITTRLFKKLWTEVGPGLNVTFN